MTVSSSTSNAEFLGNGVATAFPLPFRFFENSDITATLIDDATGLVTPLNIGVDYQLAGAGDPEVDGMATGTLTMLTGPIAVGKTLLVQRIMAVTQPTDIVNQGRFFPQIHETVFDRLTMLIQQANAGISDALGLNSARLAWNARGLRITNVADPIDNQDAATKLWAQQTIGSLISQIQGPINNSANVLYLFPNGAAHVVQELANKDDPLLGAMGIGWKRAPVADAIITVAQMLNAQAINVWEYASDVVSKPNPADPSTWDWTPAVQAAINAAAAIKATLLFPAGQTFQMKGVTVPSNLRVLAYGATFKLPNAGNMPILKNSDQVGGNSNIDWRGGHFDGNKANQTVDYATIEFVKVTDSFFDSVTVDGNRQVVYAKGAWDCFQCSRITFHNCGVKNADKEGLWLRYTDSCSVVGGFYANNVNSGVAHTVGDYNIVRGVRAVNNGASNITMNGKHTIVANCYVEGSVNNEGIVIGHAFNGTDDQAGDLSSVTGCVSKGNKKNGIYVANSRGVSVTGNTCYGNQEAGVSLAALSNMCSVTGNICEMNDLDGVRINAQQSGHVVVSNVCRRNGTSGIVVLASSSININGNVCVSNGRLLTGHGINLANVGGTQFCSYIDVVGNTCYNDPAYPTQLFGINSDNSQNRPVKVAENRVAPGNISGGYNVNGQSNAPLAGVFVAGDIHHNPAPTRARAISHWVCVAGGTPGTWHAVGQGYGTTAERPTLGTNDAGYLYRDTTTGTVLWWTGTAWATV